MAINKSIPSEFGVAADYWRIMKLNIEVDLHQVTVVLFGWLDQDSANANAQPLIYRQYAFANDAFDELAAAATLANENIHDALKRVCEAKVLEQDDFVGGTQV